MLGSVAEKAAAKKSDKDVIQLFWHGALKAEENMRVASLLSATGLLEAWDMGSPSFSLVFFLKFYSARKMD